MHTNNVEQLIDFIYFILTGMSLSIIFDVFRVLRRTFKTSDFITNIEDVLFGIITGIIILLSIFLFNNGELRFYILIGIILGIFIYILFLSKYFIKINITIITFLKKIINLLILPLIQIYKMIKSIFFRPIFFVIINIKDLLSKIFIKYKKTTKTYKKANENEGF